MDRARKAVWQLLLSTHTPNNEPPLLTGFLAHIARLEGCDRLDQPEIRDEFLYWFFSSFQRERTPYQWPVAPEILAWFNQPVTPRPLYLTRLMCRIQRAQMPECDISLLDSRRAFLSWFVWCCIPDWNLPRSFLPDDLAAALCEPAWDESVPVTKLMAWSAGELPDLSPDHAEAPEMVARSYSLLLLVLRLGDPRLIPPYVSQFWQRRTAANPESLSAFEYLSAQIETLDAGWTPHDTRRLLTSTQGLAAGADALIGAPRRQPHEPPHPGLSPMERTVLLYRDRHSICGLAKAAGFSHDALRALNVPVMEIDYAFSRQGVPEEYAHNSQQVNHARYKLHLIHLNPEYIPECLCSNATRLTGRDYVIGQFYWELTDLSSIHECGLGLVDEIWVASEYLREIYRKRTNVPIYLMRQAVAVPETAKRSRSELGLPEGSFLFLFTFDAMSGVERKNPLSLLRAFQRAFPAGNENVTLVIKTRNTDLCHTAAERHLWQNLASIAGTDPRIRMLDITYSDDDMAALYACCDCFVTLHRSEGFGFGAAEAMAHGKPVIATNYSGVTDFCRADTAALVSYDLVPVRSGQYAYLDPDREYYWADAHIDSAAEWMRRLSSDAQLCRQLGEAGRRLMLEEYSLAALQTRYGQRLRQLGWSIPGN